LPLIDEFHAPDPFIHIDTYNAGNGITRFHETVPGWMYSKDKGVTDFTIFTHLITTKAEVEGFEPIKGKHEFDTVYGMNMWSGTLLKRPVSYVL
jgi:hypothetical protein